MNKPLVINFFGGPGTGKSTQAAMLFAKLKKKGFKVELVTEYAKDMVWQEGFKVLENQLYIFAKQYHRMWRIKDKVDIIVTDSPLIQNLAYAENMTQTYCNLVIEESNKFDNVNILLQRGKDYKTEGRLQNLEQAIEKDKLIINLLKDNDQTINFDYKISKSNKGQKKIVEYIKEKIK